MSAAPAERADIAVIGGGILGLATTLRLLEHRPDLDIVILEKEDEVATHQTGLRPNSTFAMPSMPGLIHVDGSVISASAM